MMSFFGIDKFFKFLRMIRQNGGITRSMYKLWRFDTLKDGKLVGWDAFGNRYYQNDYYFLGCNRWVEYADAVKWDYDASQVTAEWYGWLHYKTDRLPCDDPAKNELYCCPGYACWLTPHEENTSGTDRAFYPYSSVQSPIYPWDGSSIQSRKSS